MMKQSERINAVRMQEGSDVSHVIIHHLVDIRQIRHRFSSLVDDEAWTSLIWKVVNALSGDDLDELDVSVQFGDDWQVLVDEVAELVVVLVEMQHNKGLWVCLSDFPHILISRDLDHLAILLLDGLDLELLHAIGHVLPREVIIHIEVII